MNGLLEAVSTSYKTAKSDIEPTIKASESTKKASLKSTTTLSSPSDALENLRNEPDFETLSSTLRYLTDSSKDLDISSPSPQAAQIINALVTDIVPNYWHVLQGSRNDKEVVGKKGVSPELNLLLSCFRNVTGLNSIVLKLKQLIQQSKESKQAQGFSNVGEALNTLLQVLSSVLEGDDVLECIGGNIFRSSTDPWQKHIWQEFLGLIAGGKALGVAAEAEATVKELSKDIVVLTWVAEGQAYSKWIGHNVVHWLENLSDTPESAWKSCAEFMSKSFRLGHSESILQIVITSIFADPSHQSARFVQLLDSMSSLEQRNIICLMLKLLSKDYLASTITTADDANWWHADQKVVAGAAKFVSTILAGNGIRQGHLVTWLCSPTGAGVGDGIAIRRAAVAALAEDNTCLESLFERSLQQYGDQLYIRHTPTLQQDVHSQLLLLAAGYMHRKVPLRLTVKLRSGTHLSMVSNRLAATSDQARFLGMAIGEALSELVDKEDKRMDFKTDEMKTAEAKWYKGLVNVADAIGNIEDLAPAAVVKSPQKPKAKASKPVAKRIPKPSGSKIIAIEEIDDDDEEQSDNDGLTPYAKPDSDAEDSDEDPTLVIRNKPQAPVYIEDLITYLRDTDNYDRQKLALNVAPSLIRRKANFGTEVSSHAEELATLLVGLQDKYDMDAFQDMRLQGMIATLVAQPQKMGPWFSKTFFDGDYSISQRASVLTTISVGARELAGLAAEDEKLTTMKSLPAASASFPSKTLPPNLHAVYSSSTSTVNRLSDTLTTSMIAPMATSLADTLTGPEVFKVRSFSSRLKQSTPRTKRIPNALAAIVATSFFYPLTSRFVMHLRAYGPSSRQNVVFQPHLLALFLKTLSILLHASGQATLSLPQMCQEYWDLLLSLRSQSSGNTEITEGLLVGFLTVLECGSGSDSGRGLVERQGRELLETREWVEAVFGRFGIGKGGEEEEKIRMLAVGCLVRIGEMMERYRALLMGDVANFGG